MLADWSNVRAEVQSASTPQSIESSRIPEATIVGNVQYTQPGYFYYRFRIDYAKADYEEDATRHVTIRSTAEMTFGDIMKQIADKFHDERYGSLGDVKGYEFLSAVYRPIP